MKTSERPLKPRIGWLKNGKLELTLRDIAERIRAKSTGGLPSDERILT